MKDLSIPVFIILGINAYVAASFFFHYKYSHERENLFFSLSAMAAAAYNASCIMLYNSPDLTRSMLSQKMQIVALSLLGIFIIRFFALVTRHERKTLINAYSLFFLIFIFVPFVAPEQLLFNLSAPLIKTLSFLDFTCTFYEAQNGILFIIHNAVAVSAICYLVYIFMISYRKNRISSLYRTSSPLGMFIVFTIFIATSCNDILVSLDVFDNPYMVEYGFLGFSMYMSFLMASNHSLTRVRLKKSIDDQRTAFDKLEKSELRLKSIIDHANELIFTLSTEYSITFLSPAWERMLGYTTADSIGKSWFDYVHELDAPHFKNILTMKSAENLIEYRIRTASGIWLWHRATCAPVFDDAKKLLYYVGLSQDITENMQALEALRYSEERLHSIIDNANDIIFTMSSGGRITFASPAWQRSLGYPFISALGSLLSDYIHNDDRDQLADYLDFASCSENRGSTIEYRVRHLDGSWRWHRLNASPVCNQHNGASEILFYVCISQDVTGQREAAQKLRESEQRLEMALVGAEQGLWDWSFATGKVVFSKSFEDLIGINPQDVESNYSRLIEFIHPDDLATGLVSIKNHLDGKTPNFECEYRVKHSAGHYIWVQVRGKIFDRDPREFPPGPWEPT
jgi:PAS domain S-box-containing protein